MKVNGFRATIIIWHKHMRKFLQNGEELFGTMIQPILWVGIFGLGMKGLLGSTDTLAAQNYIGFMLPGIIALSLIGGAIGGGMIWLDERTKGIVKGYLVSPVPRYSIILGNILSTITKCLFQGTVIIIVGVLLGAKIGFNLIPSLLSITFIIFFATGFAGIALSIASQTNDLMAYHAMIMLLNLPLLFLSNALYPVNTMPPWMQFAVKINPTTYLVDGLRLTLLSQGQGSELYFQGITYNLLITGLFALGGFLLAFKTLSSKTRNP